MEEFDLRNIQRRQEEEAARERGRGGGGPDGVAGALNRVQADPKLLGGCCLAIPVLLLILVALSLGAVGPIEYGLHYDQITKTIVSSDAAKGGRHWIWPWGSFIKFPANTVKIEFSSKTGATEGRMTNCRTSDSLALSLSVAFQYQIRRESVEQLYQTTGSNYEGLFIRFAKQAICQTTTRFSGSDFYTQRKAVRDAMSEEVQMRLGDMYADITALQLLKIDLPTAWEEAIVATQVSKQGALTAENEKLAAIVRANIDVMVATYQNNITVILATANANATVTTRNAEAQAEQIRLQTEQMALANVSAAFTPPLSTAGQVEYQKMFAYQYVPNTTMLFGIQSASLWLESPAPPPATQSSAPRACTV